MSKFPKEGSIASMIHRFRHEKPMSREQRQSKRREESSNDKFWWLDNKETKSPRNTKLENRSNFIGM